MVHMVFVHGVKGPRTEEPTSEAFKAFKTEADARNANFCNVAFDGQVKIRDAIWGPFAAHPAWELACVPKAQLGRGNSEALGGIAELIGDAEPLVAGDTVLVTAAKSDLLGLIGGLSAASLEDARGAEADARLKFWRRAADVADTEEGKAALVAARTDSEFAAILTQQVAATPDDQVALGIDLGAMGHAILKAGGKLKSGLTDLVNSPAVYAVRDTLTPNVAIFIGDVFVYLKAGAQRTAIRNRITGEIAAAARAAKANGGEKLVLAGHSMGGVILYDLVSDPSWIEQMTNALGFPFKADLLLTIGSQPGLFEEVKAFNTSSPNYSSSKAKVPAPAGVSAWWNIWNRLDVLSFYAEPIFEGVEDLEASTSAGIHDAHGAYFTNGVFYSRLRDRLRKARIID